MNRPTSKKSTSTLQRSSNEKSTPSIKSKPSSHDSVGNISSRLRTYRHGQQNYLDSNGRSGNTNLTPKVFESKSDEELENSESMYYIINQPVDSRIDVDVDGDLETPVKLRPAGVSTGAESDNVLIVC